MAKLAFEQIFNGGAALNYLPTYNQDQLNVGTLCGQWSDEGENFVGPAPVTVLRPMEMATAIPANAVHALQYSGTEWWVFYADNATAAATRRIGAYTFNPRTLAVSWKGFITLTFPAATNHTIRGFRMLRDLYTAGTVAVSGTAVTGTGTAWSTSRLAVGSRIGFGSTDPTQISTWYQISAIGSDGSITLTGSAGTIAGGTAYVIEDMRCICVTTNATAANGGLFVAKGLRFELFIGAGTTIPAATTVDNIRAVYWLRTAATETFTTACGMGLAPRTDWQTQFIYLVNGGAGTSLSIAKMNTRAALTLSAGGATLSGGDLVTTGVQAVTGNLQQQNSVRLGTLSHAPVSGAESLFICTVSRVVRVATANVTAGSTTFISDQMQEVPPGGVNSFPASSLLLGPEISDNLDRLVIATGAWSREYVTTYRTDAGQFQLIFGADTRQQDQGTADSTIVNNPRPNTQMTATSLWAEAGFFFFVRIGTTAAVNQIYIFPGGADWNFVSTTNQRVICPRIQLGAVPQKFYRVLVNSIMAVGSQAFGHSLEAFRVVYRTAGISNNSGSWTAVPSTGDISGVSAAAEIQFAFEFRTLGEILDPARITALALLYESVDDLPSQYQWSYADSSTSDGTFGFVQVTAFGASPPVHTINVYRSDTNALVLTQASSGSTNGTFQYWDGAAWQTGLGPNTVGTRRRFVPTASLPAGIPLYAALTVA